MRDLTGDYMGHLYRRTGESGGGRLTWDIGWET